MNYYYFFFALVVESTCLFLTVFINTYNSSIHILLLLFPPPVMFCSSITPPPCLSPAFLENFYSFQFITGRAPWLNGTGMKIFSLVTYHVLFLLTPYKYVIYELPHAILLGPHHLHSSGPFQRPIIFFL